MIQTFLNYNDNPKTESIYTRAKKQQQQQIQKEEIAKLVRRVIDKHLDNN